MKSRLLRITNLHQLARDAGYKVGKLARKCKISVVQLERFIFNTTGLKAHVWLTRLRLTYAMQLLQHTALTIKEVAFAAGYKQPSHFSREFEHYYGLAPSQVQQSLGC